MPQHPPTPAPGAVRKKSRHHASPGVCWSVPHSRLLAASVATVAGIAALALLAWTVHGAGLSASASSTPALHADTLAALAPDRFAASTAPGPHIPASPQSNIVRASEIAPTDAKVRITLAWALWAACSLWAWHSVRPVQTSAHFSAHLRWDGQHWYWHTPAAASPLPRPPEVVLDLGSALLVRLHIARAAGAAPGPASVCNLWLSAGQPQTPLPGQPKAHWLELRRAIFQPRP